MMAFFRWLLSFFRKAPALPERKDALSEEAVDLRVKLLRVIAAEEEKARSQLLPQEQIDVIVKRLIAAIPGRFAEALLKSEERFYLFPRQMNTGYLNNTEAVFRQAQPFLEQRLRELKIPFDSSPGAVYFKVKQIRDLVNSDKFKAFL